MTEAFIKEVDRQDSMREVLSSVQNCKTNNYFPLLFLCGKNLLLDKRPLPSYGKIAPTPTLLSQMKALGDISFHDPILKESTINICY